MRLEKDYKQIRNDIKDCNLLLLKPMDVRSLLKLDTKTAYALFKDKDFPSMLISGQNYIMKTKFVEWYEDKYKEYLQ